MTSFGVIVLGYLIICTSSTEINDEKQSSNLTSYIVFGQEVSDPVPYIISIQYRTYKREWKHVCGGSIISSNYVLTAAHCLVPNFNDEGIKKFRILAGRTNLKSRIGSRHRVVSYTPHPEFVQPFRGYDIAVIKVRPKFKFNQKTIAKIGFDSSQRVSEHIPVVFHGWGYTGFGYPEILRMGYFMTVSEETCRELEIVDLASTDLCVAGQNFSNGYLGDSGGPLVNEKENLQIGVCSHGVWTPNAKNYSFPTIFTRVSEFSNWIKDQISK